MKKNFRYEIIGCILLLMCIMLFLLYITGPNSPKGPIIRVLHVSYADHRAVEESTLVQVVSQRQNSSVIIDREEWELSMEKDSTFTNKILLECSANFPIIWKYSGYGIPNVRIENLRKVDNFNDTNTYSFVSLLSLISLREEATGKYMCSGISKTEQFQLSFVHIFLPETEKDQYKLFILQTDITIEADVQKELLIPCPISNPNNANNVSIFYNGNLIPENHIRLYKPEQGFYLNAKFLEENDPFGGYHCEEDSKQKSGNIYVVSKKESTVRPSPLNTTVHFDDDFNGVFKCESKENTTLKFRRVTNSKKVLHSLNSSSEFPFESQVEFDKKDLREGSVILCITISKQVELHSWKVLFSQDKHEDIQNPEFSYREESDEYICCGKLSKLTKSDCTDVAECQMSKSCLDSKACKPKVLKTVEKTPCVHYKVEYDERKVSSGLLHCSIDDKSKSFAYFNYQNQNVSFKDFQEISFQNIPVPDNFTALQPLLQIEEIYTRKLGTGVRLKFRCKGPKYYFASGFVWQIIRFNGLVDFFTGNEFMDGQWIHSNVDFEIPFEDQREAKKIYCFAPSWSSAYGWTFISKYV